MLGAVALAGSGAFSGEQKIWAVTKVNKKWFYLICICLVRAVNVIMHYRKLCFPLSAFIARM